LHTFVKQDISNYFYPLSDMLQVLKVSSGLILLIAFIGLNVAFSQRLNYSKISPWLGLDTEGLHIAGQLKIQPKLHFTANLGYLGFQRPLSVKLDSNSNLLIKPDIKRLHLDLGILYQPFKFPLLLSGGFKILPVQKMSLDLSTATGIKLDGFLISSEDFGLVKLSNQWSSVQPFIGLTWLRKRWQFQLGCAYMGRPRLDIEYEGFLETTNLKTDILKIEDNIRNYSFYPLLGFKWKIFKNNENPE
jgi:hypothetical protein